MELLLAVSMTNHLPSGPGRMSYLSFMLLSVAGSGVGVNSPHARHAAAGNLNLAIRSPSWATTSGKAMRLIEQVFDCGTRAADANMQVRALPGKGEGGREQQRPHIVPI